MCVQALEISQADDSVSQVDETVATQFLNGHLPHEAFYAKAADTPRAAVGWQDMIGTAAIVPNRLGSPGPEKTRARITHIRQQAARIVDLNREIVAAEA